MALAQLAPSLAVSNRDLLRQELRGLVEQQPQKLQALAPDQALKLLSHLKGPPPGTLKSDGLALLAIWGLSDGTAAGDLEPPGGVYQLLWAEARSEPKAAEQLETSLVSKEGRVRLRLAYLLSHAYSASAPMLAWRQRLEQQAANKSAPGDTRAAWLIVRGQAQEAEPPVSLDEPGDPLKGLPWVEKAFGEAESEQLRCLALAWLVDRHVQAREFERASTMLASTRGQFESRTAQDLIARLGQRITKARQEEAVSQAFLQRRLETQQLQGQANYLQEQLEQAKRTGRSAEDLASLERLIHNTRTKLAEVEN